MLILRTRTSAIFRHLVFVCLAMVASLAQASGTNVTLSSKSVAFSASDSGVKYLSVTVVGPTGKTVFSQSGSGSVSWRLPASAEDGRYKYQIKQSNMAAGSRDRNKKAKITPKVSTQSGAFLIKSGSIVLPSAEEVGSQPLLESAALALLDLIIPPASADQVTADDVIVEGSLCAGFDCVDGEDFGFDSIRLKENNLRIHFQDTSVTAAFPTNDWRILINDTSNGGGNFFAIEDSNTGRNTFYLEAGAPNNALYVDNNGRIGFGTSTPGTNLEALSGSTPTFRFNQDGSLGFAEQSWDIGGNEQGFFVTDVSNSLATPFQIGAGAPNNAFVMNAGGNIGVGTDAPTEKLHVMGNAIISGNLELGSSRTIKHAIENLGVEQALAALIDLQPVKYRYNHSPTKQTLGFIAEDVPDLVASESRKSLKPMDIVAVLTKVVQAQQETIEELSKKVDRLSAQSPSK